MAKTFIINLMSDATKIVKTPIEYLPYLEMTSAAIVALKGRSSSSLQAIKKFTKAYCNVGWLGLRLKMALKRGVANGNFKTD